MSKCSNPDCELYPVYGVAPHICFYKLGNNKTIGQSQLISQEKWPDNFLLELEPGEKIEDVKYPNACGVYFCPTCKAGMKCMEKKGRLVKPQNNQQEAENGN